MFPHYITCGLPQREKKFFVREIKNYLKFISLIEVCHHNEIFENIFHNFFFFSFWSSRSVLTTFVYDGRLQGERRKTERKKEKCMFPHYITCGPPQREELLREILIYYLGFFLQISLNKITQILKI